MTDAEPSFGQWLRHARRDMGFTQKELAQAAGCSTTSVRKIEAGVYRPSKQVAERLVASLEVAPDEREKLIRLARAASSALPTLPAEGPQQQAAGPVPNNLPAQPTPILGREAASRDGSALLLRDDVRLLTLVGPPGIGKTRLALHLAEKMLARLERFEDGVYLVLLASVSDPGLVIPTIAHTLGVREDAGGSAAEALSEYLRQKHMLLLLDNFEHVAAAAPDLARLMSACPGLKLMVTSREVLHVRGEHRFHVQSLDMPGLTPLPPPGELPGFSSVRLFVERAASVDRDFVISEQNAASIAEICVRLDGLPLAIEIAAARTGLYSPEEIASRLTSRLRLLTWGARDLPARQQTLKNAIDWSYNLLSPAEQRLFARLAAFVGGCTLSAVEAVCNPMGDLGIEVDEGIESLLDKSMLQQTHPKDGERRLYMLETVREYALERLQQSGEEAQAAGWHTQFYLALAEAAEPELVRQNQRLWLDRLAADHDNIRSVLERHLSRDNVAVVPSGADPASLNVALRVSGALWRFWLTRGHLAEGRRWLERALEQGAGVSARDDEGNTADAGTEGDEGDEGGEGPAGDAGARASAYRARALNGLGGLAYTQGDLKASLSTYMRAYRMWQAIGNAQAAALPLSNMGLVAVALGRHAQARSYYEEALAIQREMGDKGTIARTLNNLGLLAHDQGDYAAALRAHEESLALARDISNRSGVAASLTNLGIVKVDTGDYEDARELFDESSRIFMELGIPLGAAGALINLSVVAYMRGDHATELSLLRRALPMLDRSGDNIAVANCIEGFGGAIGVAGDPVKGVRLLAAGAAFREAMSAPLPARDRARYDASVAAVRARLSEEDFRKAWSEGAVMRQKEAIDYALAE